jgi:hypothetical protein
LLTQIVTDEVAVEATTVPPAAANAIETAMATRFMVLELSFSAKVMFQF